LQTDPQAALAVDSQRMQKVNAAWSRYLVLFAGVGLMVDGFAERRAHAYESVLQGSNPRLHQK
jgi:hypothetical protein